MALSTARLTPNLFYWAEPAGPGDPALMMMIHEQLGNLKTSLDSESESFFRVSYFCATPISLRFRVRPRHWRQACNSDSSAIASQLGARASPAARSEVLRRPGRRRTRPPADQAGPGTLPSRPVARVIGWPRAVHVQAAMTGIAQRATANPAGTATLFRCSAELTRERPGPLGPRPGGAESLSSLAT